MRIRRDIIIQMSWCARVCVCEDNTAGRLSTGRRRGRCAACVTVVEGMRIRSWWCGPCPSLRWDEGRPRERWQMANSGGQKWRDRGGYRFGFIRGFGAHCEHGHSASLSHVSPRGRTSDREGGGGGGGGERERQGSNRMLTTLNTKQPLLWSRPPCAHTRSLYTRLSTSIIELRSGWLLLASFPEELRIKLCNPAPSGDARAEKGNSLTPPSPARPPRRSRCRSARRRPSNLNSKVPFVCEGNA